MRAIAVNFATVLLFAITLFFLGPPFGSLDIDGDGVPDVPILVMNDGNHQDVQRPQSDGPNQSQPYDSAAILGLMFNDTVPRRQRTVIEPRGFRRDSAAPLLC